ncbi:MAG TPA: TrkA family potassium uptake protein, partial [Caldithrix abyssi]|nr:TrkA family potassium uptake protein [Caldithrix abyssi]
MNKYLIIGLGIFGRELAMSLIEKGAEVIAVDERMELVEEIEDKVTYAIKLDAMDEKALSSIGADEI